MLADDRVGRQALRRRRPTLPGGPVNRTPEVAEVSDLAAAPAPCPLHLFGWPVQVCNAPDGEGRQLGGPQTAPAEWLWGVYAGPSRARRRQVMGLVDTADLVAWRERAQARGTFVGYLGVRTLAGYFLLAQDADGAYLTGFSSLFMFNPVPSQPPRFVYRQLVRAARWLRQSADAAATS